MNNKAVHLLRKVEAVGAAGPVRPVSLVPRTINASVFRVRLCVKWRRNRATGRLEMRWHGENAEEHSWTLTGLRRAYARQSGAMARARGCAPKLGARATEVAANSGRHDFRMQTTPKPAVRTKMQNPDLAITVGLVCPRVVQRKGMVHRSAARC
jgi:hypothetical protein